MRVPLRWWAAPALVGAVLLFPAVSFQTVPPPAEAGSRQLSPPPHTGTWLSPPLEIEATAAGLSWAALLTPVPIALVMAVFFRPVFALFAAMGPILALGRLPGDILILGAGGKMGPSLSRMAQRASDSAGVKRRVIAVSHAPFWNPCLPPGMPSKIDASRDS